MNRSFYLTILLIVKLVQSIITNTVISGAKKEINENFFLLNSVDKFKDDTLNEQNAYRVRFRIKKNRKKLKKLLRTKRYIENESFYQNFFKTENIRRNRPGQYCGEALYYLVEYYCIFIKESNVYIPETDLDLVSVISRRELSKGNHKN